MYTIFYVQKFCVSENFVFHSFMSSHLKISKTLLLICLIIALSAKVLDSLMDCILVFRNISLRREMFSALSTRVFYTFMYCPIVFSKMFILRKLFVIIFLPHIDIDHLLLGTHAKIWTEISKVEGDFKIVQGESKKRPPQFMLNISSYRHARKLGHNSLERWDP